MINRNEFTIEQYANSLSKDKVEKLLSEIIVLDKNALVPLMANTVGNTYAEDFCKEHNIQECDFDDIKNALQKRIHTENALKFSKIEKYLNKENKLKRCLIMLCFACWVFYSYIFIFDGETWTAKLLYFMKTAGWYGFLFVFITLLKQNFDLVNKCKNEVKKVSKEQNIVFDGIITNVDDIKKQCSFWNTFKTFIKKYLFP